MKSEIRYYKNCVIFLATLVCVLFSGCGASSKVHIYSWMFSSDTDIDDWKRQLGNDYVDNEWSLTWADFELIDGIKGSLTVVYQDSSILELGLGHAWYWITYGDESLYNSICKFINSKYEYNPNVDFKNNVDKSTYYEFETRTDSRGSKYTLYIDVTMRNDEIGIGWATK